MRRLVENKEDLPNAENVSLMISFMLPIKKETTYSKIYQSNIAEYLVDFIPKDSISEIKRKAILKDPVSSYWNEVTF